VFLEGKFFVPHQVCDILGVAGDKVIEPDDFVPFGKEPVAQV
jgi:hypothetical protein